VSLANRPLRTEIMMQGLDARCLVVDPGTKHSAAKAKIPGAPCLQSVLV
jgi:hypothetical protein